MKGQAMMTKLQFIYFYTVFLMFVIQISAMAGTTIVSNAPPPPTIPPQPTALDYITWPFLNIGYFFQLMLVSSTYFIFGTLILTPILIALIFIILEWARGVGS